MLNGKRVVSFCHYLQGPAATQYLADMGADVVEIEPVKVDVTPEDRPRPPRRSERREKPAAATDAAPKEPPASPPSTKTKKSQRIIPELEAKGIQPQKRTLGSRFPTTRSKRPMRRR